MGWSPKAPNTDGINQAAVTNAGIAQEQAALAREQWTDAKRRQDEFDPRFAQLIDASLASQTTQDQRSQALFDEWSGSADIRQKMNDTARNFDTPGRRAEEEARARAAVETEGTMQRQAQQRALGRAGVSLDSGRSLAMDRQSRMDQTKLSTGAADAARRNVEATGMSLVDNAAKTSMGLPSTGLQAAQLALGAGGAAAGGLGAQQGAYNASLAPSMGLFSGAVGANNSAGNLYGQIASLQSQQQGLGLAGLAGIGQAAGMMYGSGMFSSKKLKKPVKMKGGIYSSKKAKQPVEDAQVISEAPAADAVASVPTQGWQYKDQAARSLGSDVHVGPYAEDVQAGMGNDVAPGGEVIDVAAITQKNAQAIAELARVAERIEQQLGIKDEA